MNFDMQYYLMTVEYPDVLVKKYNLNGSKFWITTTFNNVKYDSISYEEVKNNEDFAFPNLKTFPNMVMSMYFKEHLTTEDYLKYKNEIKFHDILISHLDNDFIHLYYYVFGYKDNKNSKYLYSKKQKKFIKNPDISKIPNNILNNEFAIFNEDLDFDIDNNFYNALTLVNENDFDIPINLFAFDMISINHSSYKMNDDVNYFNNRFKLLKFKDFYYKNVVEYRNADRLIHYEHRRYHLQDKDLPYYNLSNFEFFLIIVYDYLNIELEIFRYSSSCGELIDYLMDNENNFYSKFIKEQIQVIKKIFKNLNPSYNINELIRKYYNKENSNKIYFYYFIEYYVNNCIKPDIEKGDVDVISKYKITANNLSTITLNIFK